MATESSDSQAAAELAEAITEALAREYGPTHKSNPDYRGYRKTPDLDSTIEMPLAERMECTCMVTFVDTDGGLSLRALTFREVAVIAARTALNQRPTES